MSISASIAKVAIIIPDALLVILFAILIGLKLLCSERISKSTIPAVATSGSFALFIVALICRNATHAYITDFFEYTLSALNVKTMLYAISSLGLYALRRSFIHKIFDNTFYVQSYGLMLAINFGVSSNNLLSLILALEVYALSIFSLLFIKSKKLEFRNTAARYLLSSSLISAILLFGASLYYAKFGTLVLSQIYLDNSAISIVSTILITCGILFKVGVVPFHTWMIDVYERAPAPIIMFMDGIWKFFVFYMFSRIFVLIERSDIELYKIPILIMSVLSMIVGSIMPIFQNNIKKFLAYSSIGHIGFVLCVFAVSKSIQETSVAYVYLLFYGLSSALLLSTMITLKKDRHIESFSDLSGLIHKYPIFGVCVITSMFGMIGMPPFANFMAKLNILKTLVYSEQVLLLAVAIFYSVMSLCYTAKSMRYIFRSNSDTHNNTNYNLYIIAMFAIAVGSLALYRTSLILIRSFL